MTSQVEELEDERVEGELAANEPASRKRSFWQRYDLGVIIFALALFAGGVFAHRTLTRPELIAFEHGRLHFQRPTGWLPGIRPPERPLALASPGGTGASRLPSSAGEKGEFHVVYSSPGDARLRLEVRISALPIYKNLSGVLSVARMARYGEYYWERQSKALSIAKRDWLRTEFRYAFKADKAGSPQIADAIEYATMDDQALYVVVAHGAPAGLAELDALLRKSLRVLIAREAQP